METRTTAKVGQAEPDEQLPHAEPRVAAAAAPHKRLASRGGVGGGGNGRWIGRWSWRESEGGWRGRECVDYGAVAAGAAA
eukprot:5061357-Prymnesium_polylepis.1